MIRLNLLPPEIKEEFEFSRRNAKIYQYLVTSIAALAVVFGLTFVVGFIVWNNQLLAAEARSDAFIQLSKYSNTETMATDINNRLGLITKLKRERLNWTKVLTELDDRVPSSVRLVSFDFANVATDRIVISGFAPDSVQVGNFRDALSKSPLFQFIDIESMIASSDPVDSARKGISFKITLTLNVTEAKKW